MYVCFVLNNKNNRNDVFLFAEVDGTRTLMICQRSTWMYWTGGRRVGHGGKKYTTFNSVAQLSYNDLHLDDQKSGTTLQEKFRSLAIFPSDSIIPDVVSYISCCVFYK